MSPGLLFAKINADPGAALIVGAILVGGFLIFQFVKSADDSKRQQERENAKEERRKRLLAKYGDNETSRDLIAARIWTGETAEQLRDSLGQPEDVDQKVLKTKSREIWKYGHKGGNRYGLRITVENGAVVGWEMK